MSKQHYSNPISKPETVTITRWEYDALVTSSTAMGILEGLISANKPYAALDVLDVICGSIEKGDD